MREETESLDVFQSFTDLMSNAFLIMSFFLLLIFLQTIQVNKSFKDAHKDTTKLQHQLAQANAKIEELKRENKKLQNAPPIIIDDDSNNFNFPSGSAEPTQALQTHINTEIPKIEKNLQEHDIDFIQVIGHTDGQAVNQSSNLDQEQLLIGAAEGTVSITSLKAGSNADLGLMRAIAVVQELQKLQRTGRLKGIHFRAYSAGQLYLPNGKLASDNRSSEASRRRIEIRFIPHGKPNPY